MFRLIMLTLAGLYGFLLWFGTPEMNPSINAAPRAPALQVAAAAPVRLEAAQVALVPAAVVQTAPVPQTPPPARRFAGPPLVPSPEHATPATVGERALVVSGDAVNLRAGPGAEHDRLGALARGSVVSAVGPTTGAWIEVRDEAGQQGFVSARFLSPEQSG